MLFLGASNFIKKEASAQGFSHKFFVIFTNTFLQNNSGWLLMAEISGLLLLNVSPSEHGDIIFV